MGQLIFFLKTYCFLADLVGWPNANSEPIPECEPVALMGSHSLSYAWTAPSAHSVQCVKGVYCYMYHCMHVLTQIQPPALLAEWVLLVLHATAGAHRLNRHWKKVKQISIETWQKDENSFTAPARDQTCDLLMKRPVLVVLLLVLQSYVSTPLFKLQLVTLQTYTQVTVLYYCTTSTSSTVADLYWDL